MQRPTSAEHLSRRDFLKWTAVGAASLALPKPAMGGWFGGNSDLQFDRRRLADTHDLPSLPDWGPYSKKHFGVSHIPDLQRGLMFDFSVFPLPAHGPVKLPSVTDKSGVHPWEAAPGLEFYSLRFETIWQDQLYCDIAFSKLSDRSRLVRMELVNNTSAPQEMTLNCLAQMVFPPVKELTAEPIRLCVVKLPPGGIWVHALDYADLKFAKARPTDNLVPDGKWRGEERRHDAVDGAVLAQNFGVNAGDSASYRISLPRSLTNATLVWRFQAKDGDAVDCEMTGITTGKVTFKGDGNFATVAVPLGNLPAGTCDFRFSSAGGAAIALNGFALLEDASVGQLQFVEAPWHPVPSIEEVASGLVLKYEDAGNFYGFHLGLPLANHRELKWRDLDTAFGNESGPDTKARIFGDRRRGRTGDPDSLFIHARSESFSLAPNSTLVIYGMVATGSETQVRRQVTRFNPDASHHERSYKSAVRGRYQPDATPAGEEFQPGQRLMAAMTLTNLVYPLNVQRDYIRHFSPGRIWDCVYTWDTGFIGLGLLEIDPVRAIEILNAYTMKVGAQSAFLHHGSPVPVQIYLFYELWNRTQSRELLEYFYPRLLQYHRFLAGRLGGSTTRKHQDHLICTWDYFYNSGGWDDYPPQKYVHQQKLEPSAAPVINSAQTIRCAKMLRAAAAALGRTEDFGEYDADIAVLSESLQKYSWDAESGYFGYVLHDEQGAPKGILRDQSGANFNMGLDGIYPLIAGICTPEQEETILDHLFSPKHLWMDIGITTVDQSAPYFLNNGYWNGSVWLAHQWFVWKTMLDLGRGDLAVRIAQTGLQLWKRVTGATYDCMEHFTPQEPYGFGWHQFTSLSSPALSWFSALYTPGRLTCGFDLCVQECRFSRNNRRLRAVLKRPAGDTSRPCSVLVCMSPAARYRVSWNGTPLEPTSVHDACLQIQLPGGADSVELVVTPV